jgi:hypothetical protein
MQCAQIVRKPKASVSQQRVCQAGLRLNRRRSLSTTAATSMQQQRDVSSRVCRNPAGRFRRFSPPLVCVLLLCLHWALAWVVQPTAAARSSGASSPSASLARGPRRRVALLSVPLSEHLTPLLFLAAELRTRGHNVTILSYSSAEHRVADLGLPVSSHTHAHTCLPPCVFVCMHAPA